MILVHIALFDQAVEVAVVLFNLVVDDAVVGQSALPAGAVWVWGGQCNARIG